MTAPSAITLNRPLPKFAAACLPNTRLKPAPGETLLNLGLSDSADHTSRCCTMLPAMAAIASIRNGTPSAASSTYPRLWVSANRPGPSAWIIQELATRVAQRHQDPAADGTGKCRQHQRAAGNHEPGVDFLALDDIATVVGVIQTLLCRVFCFIRGGRFRRPSLKPSVERYQLVH